VAKRKKDKFRWRCKHLLGLRDLDREEIEFVLDAAKGFEQIGTRPIKKTPPLRGKVVVNMFFEDSTRTRISFALAASRLSADVIEFTKKSSSVSKGETLLDTARNLEVMGVDIVVVRAPHPGTARRLYHPSAQRLPRRPENRHRRRHCPLPRRRKRYLGNDKARRRSYAYRPTNIDARPG